MTKYYNRTKFMTKMAIQNTKICYEIRGSEMTPPLEVFQKITPIS